MAFPEWKVYMPPRGHASQNDLFVLARDCQGSLISLMVEGKVAEPFGETLDGWLKNPTPGKLARLAFIESKLGLTGGIPGYIRYQLLHRVVSDIMEAERFHAKSAVMIVHSFSPQKQWFHDFAAFVELFHVTNPEPGQLCLLHSQPTYDIYTGWASAPG